MINSRLWFAQNNPNFLPFVLEKRHLYFQGYSRSWDVVTLLTIWAGRELRTHQRGRVSRKQGNKGMAKLLCYALTQTGKNRRARREKEAARRN